jgi:hypothetical protein
VCYYHGIDDEWLNPDQPGRSLRTLFRQHRRPLSNAVGIALLATVVLLGAATGPGVGYGRVGPPPADRQLLWFAGSPTEDPHAVHLLAIDWNGVQLGTLTLPCRGPCSFSASPDGQRLLVYELPAQGEPPTTGMLYDPQGRRIGSLVDPFGMWADDSRHLCVLRGIDAPSIPPPTASHAELEIVDPEAGKARVVAGLMGINSPGSFGAWEVLACSVRSNRVVVAIADRETVHDLRVVQLSTGRTLYTRDDLVAGGSCGCPIRYMVVNPSAGIAIENLVGGGIQLRDLRTGATSAWQPGSAEPGPVFGLSWRGGRVLVQSGIIELNSGRHLWRAPSPTNVGLITSRPESDDVLVYISAPNLATVREVIVQSDGRSIPLAIRQEP